MDGRILDFVALGLLCFVVITIIYGIIYIHDIPYMIAKKRNHPHQDAIHTAGWVSLFLMHTLWPFLWIWATLYKPENGWGIVQEGLPPNDEPHDLNMEQRIAIEHRELQTRLEKQLSSIDARLQVLEKNYADKKDN